MSRTAAILLAAGQGRRMQGVVADKILAPLAGRPANQGDDGLIDRKIKVCQS